VSALAGILIALVAMFATFAPATLGVILAKTIDGAGFEVKLKPSETAAPSVPAANTLAGPAALSNIAGKTSGKKP
jgi:hypothetical protein